MNLLIIVILIAFDNLIILIKINVFSKVKYILVFLKNLFQFMFINYI